jgi:hypothetical protein
MFIDPDGREIRTTDSTTVQRVIDDIRELYPDANIDYERRTRPRFSILGFEFGEIEYYSVTIDGESDFDWNQDKYASALYDIIASDEVVFNVFYQEKGPVGNVFADLQRAGGGFFDRACFSCIKEANVYVDPRGYQAVGDPSSVILMHELFHGHPVGTPTPQNPNNAHDVNRFFRAKLGLNPNVHYRSPHPGYQGRIIWSRTNLYNRRKK